MVVGKQTTGVINFAPSLRLNLFSFLSFLDFQALNISNFASLPEWVNTP